MILHGNCLDILPTLDPGSVDAVVTDPPAGISFMGREWDHHKGGRDQWIAWLTEVMGECHRVLKPGGHALVWAIPRTSHWTATAIDDAGFEVRDVIVHLFGSGFPKSHNLAGEWAGWGTALKPGAEHWILARKPFRGTVASNVLAHGTGAINVDGCRIAGEPWTAHRATGLAATKFFTEGNAKVIHKEPHNAGRWPANVILDSWDEQVSRLRYNIPDEVARLIRGFYRDYRRLQAVSEAYRNVPEPQVPQEVLQSGVLRGVVEREPQRREPSHVREETPAGLHSQDVRGPEGEPAHGTECPQLEGRAAHCERLRDDRIEHAIPGGASPVRVDGDPQQSTGNPRTSAGHGAHVGSSADPLRNRAPQERHQDGQPAREPGDHRERRPQEAPRRSAPRIEAVTGRERNPLAPDLLVLDCDIPDEWRNYFEPTGLSVPSPDSAAALLDEMSGERIGSASASLGTGDKTNKSLFGARSEVVSKYNDSGGSSRFFYCPKASRSERNAGLDGMPERHAPHGNYEGRDLSNPKNHLGGLQGTKAQNHHPTVKPIALMRWLVRLVTPPGGTVLDPFMGSGSTGVACVHEGFDFIGIEQSEEYVEIAARRIDHATEMAQEASARPAQLLLTGDD